MENCLNGEFAGKRVLITGGFGFIGSNLARTLCDMGARVTVIDSLIPEYGGNPFNLSGYEERMRTNISDVRDPHGIKYLIRDQDYLFNLAGQVSHTDSMVNPVHRSRRECPRSSLYPGGEPTI